MAAKAATREEYMKKYGPVTSGLQKSPARQTMDKRMDDMEPSTDQEAAERQFAYDRGRTPEYRKSNPATREDYMKKYGPVTTGKASSRVISEESLRAGYQKKKETERAAEEFAKLISGQTPKYGGTTLAPSWRDRKIDSSDYERMIEAGKKKPSIFKESDKWLENLSMAKYRNYNYTYMTDDEKKDYLYLVGKYGLGEADNYMKGLKDELNARSFASVAESVKEKSKDNPALGLVGNLSGSLVSGAGYVEDAAWGLAAALGFARKNANPYSIGHGASLIEESSREGIKEAARENIWDSNAMDFLVDTGLSVGQSTLRLPLGEAGTVFAGLGAATGAEEDALERGASAGQAMAQGAAQGIAEGFFEKYSIEGLEGMKAAPVYSVKDVAKNLLKQAGVEASEEMATELANSITDSIIMEDKSNFLTSIKQYKIMGESDSSATWKAIMDVGQNILLAGAGGALSGGIMGGGAAALGGLEQSRLGRQSNITDYQAFADGIDTDRGSYQKTEDYERAVNLQSLAQEYADMQSQGREPSFLQKGGFERDLYLMEQELLSGREEGADSQEITPMLGGEERADQESSQSVPKNIENDTEDARHVPESAGNDTENARSVPKSAGEDAENTGRVPENVGDDMKNIRTVSGLDGSNTTHGEPEASVKTEEEYLDSRMKQETSESGMEEDVREYGRNLGENGQNAFVENYDGTALISEYRSAFGRYYDAGRYNVDVEAADKSAISALLTPEQAAAAYKAGAQDRNLAARNMPVYVQGDMKTGDMSDLTGRASEAQKNVLSTIGKKTGLKFEIVEKAKGTSGSYIPQSGVIQIAVDSDNFLQTTSHELTHFIKDYAPESYEGYKSLALGALMQAKNMDYDTMFESYEQVYQEAKTAVTREEITDEMVADATGMFLNDKEFIGNIAKEDRTIAQKIVDFINDMIDSIRELLSGGNIRKAAKGLRENLDFYENARDMWAYALESAGEKRRSGKEIAGQDKVKNYLEHPDLVTEEHIEENYETVRKMSPVVELSGNEFSKGSRRLSDQAVDYYNSLGNMVHNDVVGDIILNKKSVKDDMFHGIGRLKAITFQSVPQVLEKGKILRADEQWKGREYDSVVIGAPISIAGGEYAGNYYELCVVKVAKDNRLYLHEVYTTKMDELSPKTGEAHPSGKGITPFKTSSVPQSGSRSDAYDLPSIYSIFEKLGEVKDGNEKTAESGKNAMNSMEGVKFQLDGVDSNRDVDLLIKENEELKAANEYLGKQLTLTKDYEPRMEDIRKVAGKILKKYNSKYSKDTLEKNLSRLYNYIRNSENVDGEEVTRAATALGRSIIEKAQIEDSTMKEAYQDVLSYIRGTKIILPENYRGDMESAGGYQHFRKKYFGTIRLGNEGISVDTAYDELAGLYPDLFNSTIANPADQLMEIARVVDEIRPQLQNPYHANMEEMAYLAGQEIFEEYFNVRSLPPTMADKLAAKEFDFNRQYNERLEAFKTRLKAEYEGDVSKAEREMVRRIQELTDQYNALGNSPEEKLEKKRIREEMNQVRGDANMDVLIGKMRYQRKRDAQESRRHRERIMKDVRELSTWLVKPTDQKHVPEQLRSAMAEFLQSIDISSNQTNAQGEPTRRTIQWAKLQGLFASIAKQGTISGEEADIYMDVDPDIVTKMEELTEKAQSFDKLDNLALKDLRTLREVVQAMKHSVLDANSLMQNRRYQHVEEVADTFQREMDSRKTKIERAGIAGKLDKMLNSDMLDAYTRFYRMGPTAMTIYEELREGFNRKVQNTRKAQDYITDLLAQNGVSEREMRKLSGKRAERHTFKVADGEVTLTTAQIMSLYCLSNRKQAQEHITSGGIKSAPQIRQTKTGAVIERTYKPVRLTPMELGNILSVLTPEQKAVGDGIVKFFTTQTSEWGNEVSMKMYGYKKFMAPNYFPIVSDKDYIATRESELGATLTTLRNMGMTKSTQPHAKNPIIIEDIFDVFTRQMDQMGSYNAFVLPLSDLQKWYNYKKKDAGSVKESIRRVFGEDGQRYITKLMEDINGTDNGSKDLASLMIRNMKSSAVGANIRTAIQQPTAYVRAMAEIDLKYLIQGLKVHVPDSEWELAKQYAPIAQWKDWGYFDINTGRSMKNILMGSESGKEWLTEKSMWLAGKGDEIAWKRLWIAAKAETQSLYPELAEGSEEFYQQAGKRMSEIIDRTQVVDTVLHRSALMKDKNGLVQMYTSFFSEPTKSYNMLYRAITDVAVNNDKETRRRAGRILGVWLVNGVATSLAAAVVDAMRDKEDKKLSEKYLTAVGENLADNLNLLNMIPLVKDVVSIFQGYQVQRTDMQAIQQLYYAMQKNMKYISGESSLTLPGLLYENTKALSTLSGVPLNNALKDTDAVVNTLLQVFGNTNLIYKKEKMYSDIKDSRNLGTYMGLAMKAYCSGDNKTGDMILEDLQEAGIDEDKIKTKYKEALKDDARILEAAEARLNSDTELYEEIIHEMEDEGYIRDYVISTVASAGNRMDMDANLRGDGLYGYGDVVRAYQRSQKDFQKVCTALMEAKKQEKMALDEEFNEADVIKNIKSQFTTEYKERYQNGSDAERKEIRTKLYQVKFNGKQLYSEKDFQNWMKQKK